MNPKHDHAVNAIDYSTFPKEYDIKAEERAVRERWERLGLYRFDPDSSAPGFSIDTPPPTVSGALHIGHVFSYTQAEIVARFERMRGKNVFYPFGFDDNGLPTERLAEREIGRRGADMPRPEFVARCLEVSSKYEARFRDLWKSLGFSTQWDLLYSTNDPGSRAESQRSFIELARSGRIYRASRPTQSCPLCGTAVAQAEAEDREIPSTMATIAFHLSDGSILPIATTRPELLPSLAAIFFAPGDPRYARFEGRTATDPIFGIRAPILADARADPAKGTGIVMACAYGDSTDVAWFETRGWTANETIGRNGRMNDRAGVWAGLPIEEARSRALGELAKRGALISTTTIRRAVNVHERCGTPLEWFSTEAWFVRLLDLKADILRAADEIEWRPAHMKDRLVAWTLGLERDWCASRSRFFGVPFPVWYCKRCGAAAFADEADLPVDPTVSMPRRACACGSMDFYPDPDVMDTWMTSSLSPRIAAGRLGPEGAKRILPFSMRPQAHDIIRTWAFYSIARSIMRGDGAPWREVMISGHSRDSSGAKISKSKGNAGASPEELVALHGADPLRYWTAGAALGQDSAYSEAAVSDGRRLVLKLWNAARLAVASLDRCSDDGTLSPRPIDARLMARLDDTIETSTAALDRREYAPALTAAERFLRRELCDDWLELAKARLRGEFGDDDRADARRTLRSALADSTRLLAPFLPHITEAVWLRLFARGDEQASVHRSGWPLPRGAAEGLDSEILGADMAMGALDCVRRAKTARGMSMAAPIASVIVEAPVNGDRTTAAFDATLRYVAAAMRIGVITHGESPFGAEFEESRGTKVVVMA